jgi:hypothetical protein
VLVKLFGHVVGEHQDDLELSEGVLDERFVLLEVILGLLETFSDELGVILFVL